MKKLNLLLVGFIVAFGICSCSDNNETIVTTVTPEPTPIPSQYLGIWKIKYKDNVDISDPGSYLIFTANKATININNNNGGSEVKSTASYQPGNPEKIFMYANTTIEIISSTIYPNFTQFVVKSTDTGLVKYMLIAKKE